MHFDLPYGTGSMSGELDGVSLPRVLDIAPAPAMHDVPGAVRDALAHPIGQERSVFETIRPGERAVILVSDSFRETRVDQCLPVLIDGLCAAGIADSDISFVFATGVHRPPTAAEQQRILGRDVYQRFQSALYCHDANQAASLRHIGVTSRGTRVSVNRRVLECDRLIVTGTVVMHYFAGFGGGRKSIIPGVAAVETISQNHSRNLDPVHDRLNPDVRIGILDGNPVAEDLFEAANMVKVDCILNTVLNRNGEIAGVFAGDLDQAHRVAAKFARRLFSAPIQQQADLVIASAGAAKNFVQAHKALYNAYQAMKRGGRVIFLAKCEEGLGAERFAHWLNLGTVRAVIAELRKNSEINGQTALSTLGKAPSTIIITDMPAEQAAMLHMTRADSLQHALDIARANLPDHPTCYVMPSASYTVPFPGDARTTFPA